MIPHTTLGNTPFERSRQLKLLLNSKQVTFAGNSNLKIYGTFSCSSGKRMKVQNRVFFESEAEAVELGYRPCGHCMRNAYQHWKSSADKKG